MTAVRDTVEAQTVEYEMLEDQIDILQSVSLIRSPMGSMKRRWKHCRIRDGGLVVDLRTIRAET